MMNDVRIRDVVIVLPNTDVDMCYGHWFCEPNSMPYLESKISDILLSLGLQTPNQRLFTIYLKVDDKLEPVPCYVSTNFAILSQQHKYVFDCKQLGHGEGPMSLYKNPPQLDLENLEMVESLIRDFVHKEISILYKVRYPDGGDAVNYILDTNENQIHFFGFDFSSKYGSSVINIEQPIQSSNDELAFLNYEKTCIDRVLDQLWAYKATIAKKHSIYYDHSIIDYYESLYPNQAQRRKELEQILKEIQKQRELEHQETIDRIAKLFEEIKEQEKQHAILMAQYELEDRQYKERMDQFEALEKERRSHREATIIQEPNNSISWIDWVWSMFSFK
jgi:hypothetical protein